MCTALCNNNLYVYDYIQDEKYCSESCEEI